MLDRGSRRTGSARRDRDRSVLAGLGLYLFLVHIVLSNGTFIPRQIFRDRNFVSVAVLMFRWVW